MPLKIELKVGLFLIISTLLIAASIGYVAYRKGFFAKTYTFTLSSKSGEDLTEGMPVVFSGFKIGTVKALELSSDGSVLITITIPEDHVKWIRADSTFIVNKPLIGSARIVVVTENLKGSILSPQQIPEVVNVSDIRETIKKAQPLLEKVNNIAGNIETMTANIADPRGSVRKILAHTENFTGNLAQKKSLLEMAISDKESIDSIHETLKQSKNTMGQVDGLFKQVDGILKQADDIPKQVAGILKQVDDIPKQVAAILRQVDDISKQVDGILKKADDMAGKTTDMLGKTDEMVYGKEGILSGVIKAIKDILAKLEKLNTTIDNINKIGNEVADSTTDLKALRSELDDTITSLGDLARELEKKIPFKKVPEIKLP